MCNTHSNSREQATFFIYDYKISIKPKTTLLYDYTSSTTITLLLMMIIRNIRTFFISWQFPQFLLLHSPFTSVHIANSFRSAAGEQCSNDVLAWASLPIYNNAREPLSQFQCFLFDPWGVKFSCKKMTLGESELLCGQTEKAIQDSLGKLHCSIVVDLLSPTSLLHE